MYWCPIPVAYIDDSPVAQAALYALFNTYSSYN